jgi:hypothetical protein
MHEVVGSSNDEVQPLVSTPKERDPKNDNDEFVRIMAGIKNGYRRSMRQLDSLLSGKFRAPSIRSQRRRKLNIVLGLLLLVTFLLLMALVGFIYYRDVYLPKFKREQLQKLIQEHAAAAKLRAEQCKGIDWKTACGRLSGASARRALYTGTSDRSEEIVEEKLLYSDDPSVTYDNFCLLTYRMRIFGDITFPYHASSRLASGGKYTMALLIQHGAMRNSKEYFCSFKRLMLEQNYRNFQDILIISPDFNYETDELVHPNDVFWNSSKPWGDWRVGAESDPDCCGNKGHMGTPKTFSSYEVLDHILAKLTNKKLFPNMNKISYVGHSAGRFKNAVRCRL